MDLSEQVYDLVALSCSITAEHNGGIIRTLTKQNVRREDNSILKKSRKFLTEIFFNPAKKFQPMEEQAQRISQNSYCH